MDAPNWQCSRLNSCSASNGSTMAPLSLSRPYRCSLSLGSLTLDQEQTSRQTSLARLFAVGPTYLPLREGDHILCGMPRFLERLLKQPPPPSRPLTNRSRSSRVRELCAELVGAQEHPTVAVIDRGRGLYKFQPLNTGVCSARGGCRLSSATML
ncbi:hypothetical protein LY78DRAFT_376412 [Colletotrichum sublineola]|nr:hypothetical protein LY78DRAFT_376412 [Colletotrichum sublineola]